MLDWEDRQDQMSLWKEETRGVPLDKDVMERIQASMRAPNPEAKLKSLNLDGKPDRKNDTNAGAQKRGQEVRLGVSKVLLWAK